MLRMSEVNAVDHQSMQHLLTEGCVDWSGFGRQIASEANELLGGTGFGADFCESGFAEKDKAFAGICWFVEKFGQTAFLHRVQLSRSEK